MSQNLVKLTRNALLGAALAMSGIAATAGASFAASETSAKEPLPFINLQLRPWTVVAEKLGILKEEYDKIGIQRVNLIASGAAELLGAEAAAVDNGALAIAQRMVYPATVHKANGLDAVIVWLSEPSDKYRTPILARANDDSINSVEDLDGKIFASSRISCYFTSPFEILSKAGVPLDSRLEKGRVRYQSIDNSAAVNAALLSGAIDATAAHLAVNNAAALWLSGEVKIVGRSPDDGVYVNGAGRVSYFAQRTFVDTYPEAIHAFLVAHERTKDWIHANIDEAAEIIAEGTRVPVEIAKFQITDESTFEFMAGEPDADAARENIKDFQAWYIANGDDILVERRLSDEQIDDFIDGRFFAGGEFSIYN